MTNFIFEMIYNILFIAASLYLGWMIGRFAQKEGGYEMLNDKLHANFISGIKMSIRWFRWDIKRFFTDLEW